MHIQFKLAEAASSRGREGRKERKDRNIVVWQMTLVFSTSLCKRQVIHKWFSKCWLCWKQIRGSSKHHKEVHEAGTVFAGAPGRSTLLRVTLSPRRAAPRQQNPLKGWTLLFQPQRGLALEKTANPTTASSFPTVHQGWPCKLLSAHTAHRHQETQEEAQIVHDQLCQCPFAWQLPLWEGALVQSGWGACCYKIGRITFAV